MRFLLLIGMFVCWAASNASAEGFYVVVEDDRGNPVSGAVVTYVPKDRTLASPGEDDSIIISQRNLEFQPFTTLAPVGSTISFRNDDTVLHHVFSFSKAMRFDLKLFGQNEPQSVTFEHPGIVTVGCNIHDGMIAHIFLSDAPFAIQTDEDGIALIEGAPASSGQLMVWHPLMRKRDNRLYQTVSISGDMGQFTVSSKFRKGIKRSSDY